MNRVCIIFFLLLAPLTPKSAAQDADKPDVDERFTRINTTVEAVVASNAALQKRIDQLAAELRAAREEQNRGATNFTVGDELRKLAEAIREVDRKREADKQLILEQLDKIAKNLAEAAAAKTTVPAMNATTNSVSEKGYEYVVQRGDTLDEILKAFNTKFKETHQKSVARRQVVEANPGLKPDRLRAGQKIFIPQPAAE